MLLRIFTFRYNVHQCSSTFWSLWNPWYTFELDARLGKAASTFEKLRSRVWSDQHCSIHVKIRVYVACVLSMLLYSCETWPTHRHQGKRLNALHFRCLRSILGVSSRDRIPYTTILERAGAPDVFSLRIYRLCWSGHVCRMKDGRLPKDIFYRQLSSAPRPVGCTKLRYKDVLKRDLKALSINTENWEQLALELASWRSLLQDRRAYSIQTYITDCNLRRTDR